MFWFLTRRRWAAKEACRKACDHLGNSNGFKSIVILPVSATDRTPGEITTRPRGLILRQALHSPSYTRQHQQVKNWNHMDIEESDGLYCEISISHDGDYATAVAIVPSTSHFGEMSH